MEILIARHGQSVANAIGIFAGQKNYRLTIKGALQAWRNRSKVASAKPFDLVFTSDLQRADWTARLFKHGCRRVIRTPLLRERGLGKIEGKNPALFGLSNEFEKEHYAKDPGFYELLEIEPLEETLARVRRVIQQIKESGAKRVLVVAHGTINSYLISELLRENEETRAHKDQANDEIHYVKLDGNFNVEDVVLNWPRGKPA